MAHLKATPPVSLQTKPRRKRRPTRTPKPSTGIHSSCASRLCSPSPYLDRSFERKKLYFGHVRGLDDDHDGDNRHHHRHREQEQEQQHEHDEAESAEETESSEYVPDTELEFDASDSDYHSYPEEVEHKQSSLADQIENLQITSNQARGTASKPSIKIRKKTKKNIHSSKISKQQKIEKNSENKKQQIQTQTQTQPVRITKSQRLFKQFHELLSVLVAPSECGSGCPLFCSRYKGESSVTKLLPLFANEEFSKEENVDNALREFELHADVYRKGVKRYGAHDSPTVAIHACVSLKHETRPYLAFVMPQLHCNLAQFVRRYRRLTTAEGRALMCSGLRFLRLLRDAQMVHCDIKPENIFVSVVDAHKLPSRPTKAQRAQVRIDRFVFADFGCAAVTTEEFPYGNLTGTITMWDAEALGRKYGSENGFDARNDLYGVIGSLFDAMYGGSLMEELLQELDEDWEAEDWEEYGALVRKCRKQIVSAGYLEPIVRQCIDCDDEVLNTVLLQLGKPRKQRMSLQQLLELVNID